MEIRNAVKKIDFEHCLSEFVFTFPTKFGKMGISIEADPSLEKERFEIERRPDGNINIKYPFEDLNNKKIKVFFEKQVCFDVSKMTGLVMPIKVLPEMAKVKRAPKWAKFYAKFNATRDFWYIKPTDHKKMAHLLEIFFQMNYERLRS